MCIAALLWKAHPLYPLLLLLNRDEYHDRVTDPLDWWKKCDDEEGVTKLLGGRDAVAGGTWLACNQLGMLAFVTNVREVQKLSQAKSRGDLPVRFLTGSKSPMEFAEEVAGEADQYNGFNLILADVRTMTMVYVTNRAKEVHTFITEVSPGIHVLTNDTMLDSPWPKSHRLGNSFRELVNRNGDDKVSLKEMCVKLMTDTIKDEKSLLPRIYPLEVEYELSSIFIDSVPQLGHYGTRSTSAVSVNTSGEVTFYERSLAANEWHERTKTFQIKVETE